MTAVDLKPAPEHTFWESPHLATPLANRDVPAAFRELSKLRYSQHRIAALTEVAQPQVWAILHGRPVLTYNVLQRVYEGINVPPCLVGMATCCNCCTRAHRTWT